MSEQRREREQAGQRRTGPGATSGRDTAGKKKKVRQQANPGDVEPGFGNARGEPNPGNRKADGDREQANLPGNGQSTRNIDRGTH